MKKRCTKGVVVVLPYLTDGARLLTKAAFDVPKNFFQPGIRYSKAEAVRLDLPQPSEFSDDLFLVNEPVKGARVMAGLQRSMCAGEGGRYV